VATVSGVLIRHWAMLRLVPSDPGRITTTELQRGIEDHTREKVHVRSIQRDLEKLQDVFPDLKSDTRNNPYGWYWRKGAERIEFPSMDGYTALTFRLVEQYIASLMPPSARRELKSYFTRAGTVLAQIADSPLARWQDQVRVIPRDIRHHLPKIPESISHPVYDALLRGQRLKVNYLPLGRETAGEPYELNPLGLVVSNHVYYLVATAWGYEDIRQYALHRMRKAEILPIPALKPKGFSLDRYIASGAFDVLVTNAPVKLKLRMSAELARHLEEAPLSDDQAVKVETADTKLISATVQDSNQLRWWILSQGEQLEVLAPKSLRAEIARTLKATAKLYA